ncbi:hypothetical protein [Kibdelosporangium phytohabitans]|uniref:Uncharacterized protein n=1 Tax=Kibdelosporangium phytohabitans TaxID=860235 RepID=A0A0N9IDG3_9PSEU|nr:hypothetical protein [Kibdelosporangium phytohabitans]ALG13345.1 hypothetical protein AOZ06_46580 [Kibdelosporangium phytohabitans]MBE1465127.1 hypothetical protein [Kibdelosporangium phytohabitans]
MSSTVQAGFGIPAAVDMKHPGPFGRGVQMRVLSGAPWGIVDLAATDAATTMLKIQACQLIRSTKSPRPLSV